jgi:hypothetical protein
MTRNAIKTLVAGCAGAAACQFFCGCDGSDDSSPPQNTSGVHVVDVDDDQGLPPEESGIQSEAGEAGAVIGRAEDDGNASAAGEEAIPAGMQRITVRGLRMYVPENWQREAPSSTMRDIQMRVPGDLPDTPHAGFVVYGGIGGSVQQNIDRWTQQFTSDDGSTVRPVIEDIWAGDLQIAIVELSGTYTSTMMPGESGGDVTMIQAIVETPSGEQIFIRLLGPRAVVASNNAAFRAALAGLAPAR